MTKGLKKLKKKVQKVNEKQIIEIPEQIIEVFKNFSKAPVVSENKQDDDELFQTQATDITGDLITHLKNIEDPNVELRLSKVDLNNGQHLVQFLRLFGIPASSLSYSQIMQELAIFHLEPHNRQLKIDHENEVAKLEEKLNNLRQQLRDLNVEPEEDNYLQLKEQLQNNKNAN